MQDFLNPSGTVHSFKYISMAELVTLNVGGEFYTTTRATLTTYPDSMLGAMFSGRFEPATIDKDGIYFIDRDGGLFKHVLNFLRSSVLCLPHDFKNMEALVNEAMFYQIDALLEALNERKPVLSDTEEYIEVVCQTYHNGSSSWQFWGSKEYLDNITEIQKYEYNANSEKRYTVDRIQLFKELNGQGFVFKHSSFLSVPAPTAPLHTYGGMMPGHPNYQIKIIRWIYIRNRDTIRGV